ncbi:hypothetical protein [Rhodococcus sp. I2R]|uniref:hypothetical protein n=1 Tax=Rhodococcus sp. I2R TaxID=2855445 RepID=UPI001E2A504D|nr:hypothetical protein [Rhodococcus sp. I2R]MCC8930530.1 hypothetical protein [Rhodococcus sp. I2R]
MWISRFAAALALTSAVLHLRMGVADFSDAILAAMALLCVFCAVDLWRSHELRPWVMVAVTSAGMLLAHSAFPSGHHHVVSQTPSMSAASAVAALELFLAGSVVFFRTRRIPSEFFPNRLQELR